MCACLVLSVPLNVWEGLRFVIVALPGLFSYLLFYLDNYLHFIISFSWINLSELGYSVSYKTACAQADQSLRRPSEEVMNPYISTEGLVKTLIRLCRCAG